MQELTPWCKLLDWHLPLACVMVILASTLYTHHHYHSLLRDCSETQMLRDLASIQIMGVLLAASAISAMKMATMQGRHMKTSHLTSISTHPMLPQAAARRRQQMPLV